MDRMTDIAFSSHQGSWAFVVVLFIISFILYKANKEKGANIVQMILRLFFVIMLASGILMVIGYKFPLVFIVKGVLAVLLIGFMEMALGKTKRKENAATPLLLTVIALVVVALMGFGVISF